MKTFQELFELISEGISDIVWHYTKDPVHILKSNKFSLGTETGSDITKSGKAFFMSTARSKLGSYSNTSSGTIFKLDGRKINQNYKGSSVDYWGGTKAREEGKHEMEDRIYSDRPVIENANQYILEIQCWISERQKKDKSVYLLYLKELEDVANAKNIPIKFFDGYNNFIQNKDPKASIDDIVDISTITPFEKYKPRRFSNTTLRDFLNFILLLNDPMGRYRYYDSGLVLNNEYDNYLKRAHTKTSIYGKELISKLLRKLKLKSVDELIKLRVRQYNEIDSANNNINYLKRQYKTIINDMKSGKDYDFDIIYNLSKNDGLLRKIPDAYEKLIYNYRKSNEDGILDIFNQAISEFEENVKNIKSTLLPIKIKEAPPKKIDYSWRDNQI